MLNGQGVSGLHVALFGHLWHMGSCATLTRMPSTSDQDQRLDSWKAIARHLGRSVRTVRRWEESESLPIHRLMHGNQGSVYAFANELDAWWEQRSKGPENSLPTHVGTAKGSGTAIAEQLASSIAVLPFRFSGPEASQQWIAQGLAEEIIGSFSRLANIRVNQLQHSGN